MRHHKTRRFRLLRTGNAGESRQTIQPTDYYCNWSSSNQCI